MARRIVIFGWAESVHIQRWTAGLRERGYQIKLISLGGEPLPEIETVIFPRQGKLSYFKHAAAAAREAHAFKPDLVHVHYAAGFGYWGTRTNFAPLIVSVWGSDIEQVTSNRLMRFFIRRSLKRASHLTATSEYLRRQVMNLSPRSSDKCTIIPFGVPLPRETRPLPPSSPLRLCYLKLHSRIYAPEIAVAAVAGAIREGAAVELSLAGSGDMTDELRRLVVSLDISDHVTFPGFIDNSTVYDFLAEHHALIMPSRQEAFGVAVLEAGACGRLAIGSSVGGIPEIIEPDVTGLLVPPGDIAALQAAVLKLVSSPDLIARMGDAARARVLQKFTWSRSLDSMCSLYEELIDG